MAGDTDIRKTVEAQRAFFASGATIPVQFRIDALKRLKAAIQAHEAEIEEALLCDVGKSSFESYMCEVGMTLAELCYHLKHLHKWVKPHRVASDFANFHSSCFRIAEPYGLTLVMSPWNYPFMLTLEPLIGAVAAGNCCVVKPSAYSAATSMVVARLIAEVFDPAHVSCVLGGRAENTSLLDQRWDYIFFTGSPAVGRLVMEKASHHLTPVSLELGGKSPCVIAKDANLELAARRLAFGKYLNVGQTCIAPDYVLCEESVHDEFVGLFTKAIVEQYGANALENPDYGQIVNDKHFDRICGLINPNKIAFAAAGQADPRDIEQITDRDNRRIAPVVMCDVTDDDAVMGEEIFGPLCPILKVKDMAEAEVFIKAHEKPLALYLFSNNRAVQERFMKHVPFGGGCINDTIVHIATSNMPFGGVGNSGMGAYHGKWSFDTFSHTKSVLRKHNWIDVPLRMQPYTAMKEKILRMFLR